MQRVQAECHPEGRRWLRGDIEATCLGTLKNAILKIAFNLNYFVARLRVATCAKAFHNWSNLARPHGQTAQEQSCQCCLGSYMAHVKFNQSILCQVFSRGLLCVLLYPGSTSDWCCCCTDQGCEAKAVFDSHSEDAREVMGETLLIHSHKYCERGTVCYKIGKFPMSWQFGRYR